LSGGLARRLGPTALVFYGIGDILGAGIYALVGKVAAEAGSAAWASFLVSAALAAVTGLAYAELCARVPRSAGSAAFAAEAFAHPLIPYLVGVFVLMSGITSTATVSLAVHGYLKAFVDVPQLAGALLLIALMGLIAFWGIRESVAANNAFTLAELSGLLFVVVMGLSFAFRKPAGELLSALAPSAGPLAVLSGATLAFYAFIGFEDLANLAEEAVDPVRDIPRAILVSFAVSTVLYLVVVFVVLWSMTPAQAAATPRPLLEVLRIAGSPLPDWCFSGIALFAVFNTGLANFIMASRLLYGMGDQGLAPRALSVVHRFRRTPWAAVLAAAGLTALLVLTAGEKGVALMAKTTAVLLMLAFVSSHVSLIRLRGRPAGPEVFRAPRLTPYAGIAVAALMLSQAPGEAWLRAGGVLAGGLLLWALMRRSVS
jgi:basic amino acid/polyamine antiporter, APA family